MCDVEMEKNAITFPLILMELSSQTSATPARVDEAALSQLISLGGLIITAYKFSMCDITYAPTNNLRLCLAHQEKIKLFFYQCKHPETGNLHYTSIKQMCTRQLYLINSGYSVSICRNFHFLPLRN